MPPIARLCLRGAAGATLALLAACSAPARRGPSGLVLISVDTLRWRVVRTTRDPFLPSLYSLKVALTVFYAFIPIPYSYLWVVPVVVSSQVLAAFLLPPPNAPARLRPGPASPAEASSLENASGVDP